MQTTYLAAMQSSFNKLELRLRQDFARQITEMERQIGAFSDKLGDVLAVREASAAETLKRSAMGFEAEDQLLCHSKRVKDSGHAGPRGTLGQEQGRRERSGLISRDLTTSQPSTRLTCSSIRLS